jgi:hypothetical protein
MYILYMVVHTEFKGHLSYCHVRKFTDCLLKVNIFSHCMYICMSRITKYCCWITFKLSIISHNNLNQTLLVIILVHVVGFSLNTLYVYQDIYLNQKMTTYCRTNFEYLLMSICDFNITNIWDSTWTILHCSILHEVCN